MGNKIGKTLTCTLLGVLMCASASAGGGAKWRKEMDFYKAMRQPPMQSMALGQVNVRLGMELERLTLLSGEGHTGKKVATGLLAVAVGAMGGSGDMAQREPLEEHFLPDDAKKIADEVAQSVQAHLVIPGVTVMAGDTVTANPAYQSAPDGSTETKKETLRVKNGRFSREQFIGYWMLPAGGYAYRGPTGGFAARMGFGGQGPLWGDKTFSPVVRTAVGAQTLATVDVFLLNTRKDFRVEEMKIRLLGQTRGPGTDNILMSLNLDPAGQVAVPVTGSHKDNYAYWQALKPLFEAKLDEVSALMAASTR